MRKNGAFKSVMYMLTNPGCHSSAAGGCVCTVISQRTACTDISAVAYRVGVLLSGNDHVRKGRTAVVSFMAVEGWQFFLGWGC